MRDFINVGLTKCMGVLLGLASAFCYTTENFLLFKEREKAHPFLILSFSSLGATAPVLFLSVQNKNDFIDIPRQVNNVLLTVLCGFFGATSHILFGSSLFLIGPGNSTMLFYTQPVFALLLSGLFLKDAFKRTDVLFVGFTIIAVILVASFPVQNFFENESSQEILSTYVGFILGLCSAAFSGGQLVIARKLVEVGIGKPPIILSYLSQYFIYSLTLCTIFQAWKIPPNVGSVVLMLVSGFALFSAITLTYISLSYEKPTVVSVALASEVLIAYFGEHFFFESDLHPTVYIACIFVIASCVGMAYTHQPDTDKDDEESECILGDAEQE